MITLVTQYYDPCYLKVPTLFISHFSIRVVYKTLAVAETFFSSSCKYIFYLFYNSTVS